jgi:hypothetical protein
MPHSFAPDYYTYRRGGVDLRFLAAKDVITHERVGASAVCRTASQAAVCRSAADTCTARWDEKVDPDQRLALSWR